MLYGRRMAAGRDVRRYIAPVRVETGCRQMNAAGTGIAYVPGGALGPREVIMWEDIKAFASMFIAGFAIGCFLSVIMFRIVEVAKGKKDGE